MKYNVRGPQSLQIALERLAPIVRDSGVDQIQNGRKISGLLPREIWANWLLCVAANAENGVQRFTFLTDPFGSDGVIWDTQTKEGWPIEHIMVPKAQFEKEDAGTLILNAINAKRKKGASYASGKTLVVFLNARVANPWYPNAVAKQLPEPLHFATVYVVGLNSIMAGKYTYNVVHLVPPIAPIWRVRIAKSFKRWRVEPLQ